MSEENLGLFGIGIKNCPANYRLAITDDTAITVLVHQSIWESFCTNINSRNHSLSLSKVSGSNTSGGESVLFTPPKDIGSSFGYRDGITRDPPNDSQWERLLIRLPMNGDIDTGINGQIVAVANARTVFKSLIGLHSDAQEYQLLTIWDVVSCGVGCKMSQAIGAWVKGLTAEQRARIEDKVSLAMRVAYTVIFSDATAPLLKGARLLIGMHLVGKDGIALCCFQTNSGSLSTVSISEMGCDDLTPHNIDCPFQALVITVGLAKLYEIARAALYPTG